MVNMGLQLNLRFIYFISYCKGNGFAIKEKDFIPFLTTIGRIEANFKR
jgi:hypothetical protein